MNYLNFHLRVWSKGYGDYIAEVRSPFGEYVQAAIAAIDPMQIMSLHSELAAKPTEEKLRALGTLLFENLFTEKLRIYLWKCLKHLQTENLGLRLQLEIEPNELSALPWELLFDPAEEQFLALSPQVTIVRSLPSRFPSPPPRSMVLPLRILAVFPSPAVLGLPALDVTKEQELMEEALKPLFDTGRVELIELVNPTFWNLVERLYSYKAHILYYQGHIGFENHTRSSFLMLKHGEGMVHFVKDESLVDTLLQSDVRLAVINSCGDAAGSIAHNLVRLGVPAVVVTREPLTDYETQLFLSEFHQALAEGVPVDAAMANVRCALCNLLYPTARWASPMLVARLGAEQLFVLGEPL